MYVKKIIEVQVVMLSYLSTDLSTYINMYAKFSFGSRGETGGLDHPWKITILVIGVLVSLENSK